MTTKLYVGGLSYATTNESLEDLFAKQGTVASAVVINDRDSGRSKGFGFVEMSSFEEAELAIQHLDGVSFDGRNIKVNQARERAPQRSNDRW